MARDENDMNWRKTVFDWCADFLRLIARLGLLVNCILISAFTVWFVWKSGWKLMDLCNTWLFAD